MWAQQYILLPPPLHYDKLLSSPHINNDTQCSHQREKGRNVKEPLTHFTINNLYIIECIANWSKNLWAMYLSTSLNLIQRHLILLLLWKKSCIYNSYFFPNAWIYQIFWKNVYPWNSQQHFSLLKSSMFSPFSLLELWQFKRTKPCSQQHGAVVCLELCPQNWWSIAE